MASAGNQAISTLLAAESDAAKIVQKAKQYRVQRLKDARTEAAKEIEALKAQKNKEFQAFESSHVGDSNESVTRVTQETASKLASDQEAFMKNKNLVVEKLLAAVVDVQPQVHENMRVRAK